MTQLADFVVIGAGSAGCVVARVLADHGFDVTIIEAGQVQPVTLAPANYLRDFGTEQDWAYQTVPQPSLASRRIRWPRGRGLGGSTRINATIWLPPLDRDLQNIAYSGGSEWSIDAVKTSLDEVTRWVAPEKPRWISEASRQFIAAVRSLELPATAFDRMTSQGRRRTAWEVLQESKRAASVKCFRGQVSQIDFVGTHASEVQVADAVNGSIATFRARHSIIVCCGALGSAELLMRSGIGRTLVLSDASIPIVCESEQVGLNLCDHLIMPIVFAVEPHHRFATAPTVHDMARFHVAGNGPLASNLAESGLLHETNGTSFQLHVTPTHYLLHPDHRAPAAMTLGVNLTNPRSRGCLQLKRFDDHSEPQLEIDPAYLNDPADLTQWLEAIEFTRTLVHQSTLAKFVRDELLPGAKRGNEHATTRSVARFAQTLYHPIGTCRMGTDQSSVVDHRLAVRGVSGLHVIDASILPTMPSVNPNALVMTIAMHAAKLLASRF